MARRAPIQTARSEWAHSLDARQARRKEPILYKTLMRGLRKRQAVDGLELSREALTKAYLKASTRPAIYFNLTLAALLVFIAPIRHLAFELPFFPSPFSMVLEWGVMVPSCLAVAYVHATSVSRPHVEQLLALLIALGFSALIGDVMIWRNYGIPIPHEYSGLFFIAAISVAGLPARMVVALSALFLPLCIASLLAPGDWTPTIGGFSLYFDLVAVGFSILNARSLRSEAGMSWALTEKLGQLNHDLGLQVEQTRAAFTKLKDTQNQLVQAEKLASLGGLVAGVAHEINTPIGVGVLAASSLHDDMQNLREAFAESKLTRSQLQSFIAGAEQASGMILSNLKRASDLIGSFKRVAVDQASNDVQKLGLCDYINEVLTSLRPLLRATPHRIELQCDPDIQAELVPGALAQILTNLVMNALTHAFAGIDKGLIVIQVEPHQDDQLLLRLSDNGNGIPPEVLPKIFDPFFTTQRGAGGTGLGLHIVFNLAHQTLGGTIEAMSTPGQGTSFLIRFPKARAA